MYTVYENQTWDDYTIEVIKYDYDHLELMRKRDITAVLFLIVQRFGLFTDLQLFVYNFVAYAIMSFH